MQETLIAGFFGCLGVFVGSFIQHWGNRRASAEARYLELKSNAYADFINAVAMAAHLEDSQHFDSMQQLAAAKSRICVFGDVEVVDAIARLERTSLELSNSDARDAFLDLVRVVRAHTFASGTISDGIMSTVLFGTRGATEVSRSAS